MSRINRLLRRAALQSPNYKAKYHEIRFTFCAA